VAEVIPFERQRLARDLGECISKAIAEIQLCSMAATLAEIFVGVPNDPSLILGDRLDSYLRHLDQFIEASAGDRIPAGVDDKGGFGVGVPKIYPAKLAIITYMRSRLWPSSSFAASKTK